MDNHFRSYTIVLLLFFTFQIVNAQEKFSEFELTGKQNYDSINEYKNLQKEVYEAFIKMKNAAVKDSIFIEIASGYRSFDRQKLIWNGKYSKYVEAGLSPYEAVHKIIEYSTIPGTSRHHWGTDIDIYDLNAKKTGNILSEENYNSGGIYERLKIWMDKHSEKFGFELVYTNKKDRKGFKYEPWHYSFKSISKSMLRDFFKLDIIAFLKIQNLEGREVLTNSFIEKYFSENILDINPNLR